MMRPLSVLLVDDVALARHRLRELLAHIPPVRVDAEAASLDQARKHLQGRRFDLLLLDLVLPDGRGWELPAQQPALAAHTIFVTALPQHALQAFELGVADYLLKPVALPRLQEAITRVRRLAGLLDDGQANTQVLAVPAVGGTQYVPLAQIDYIDMAGHYACVHVGQRLHLLRETIARLAERLAPGGLLRVHRSVLVNPLRVQGVVERHNGDALLELAGGAQVPVSRSYRTALASALDARLKHR
ncbi:MULTISPECIES: LytR/AlgR family response regulator transcription factor [Stenotrophomonas]|uniref:DNA-binding response regulator n=1 Tax=Stenotrophomonas maltophilia TaxID=40324 RepID=A0A2J0SMP2_STEMA|nr:MULTISPECIES: LytTR family DNA-binding domain-containing protein [Stenotrophomonas]MBA0311757.1 DNA-binding response regulator [Stenotrophomonas maltophilia]MBH1867866.1 response regulator transcription factor [Stenotrophomonas maltophilia]MDH1387604.1 LytTR family DNA-binding domain-containing protein [Stenotrophomonas sp. GD03701]MDH1393743.1 LytTR family DNA-binding domain-containing protein [Stenotrophomonas sp. GD03702]MDQ7303021.1 LytTR family DNA-binding domain-containing protein [St